MQYDDDDNDDDDDDDDEDDKDHYSCNSVNFQMRTSKSVSYTHLTLPTILLV